MLVGINKVYYLLYVNKYIFFILNYFKNKLVNISINYLDILDF